MRFVTIFTVIVLMKNYTRTSVHTVYDCVVSHLSLLKLRLSSGGGMGGCDENCCRGRLLVSVYFKQIKGRIKIVFFYVITMMSISVVTFVLFICCD